MLAFRACSRVPRRLVRNFSSVQVTLNDPSLLKTQAFINGEWVGADSGKTYAVNDPATGELICDVPHMGAAETKRAIECAVEAQKAWKNETCKARAAVLRKW
jgi:succinate-semialdehyde dehydrogenase/glutarate-semialdehyde dehydrogenase